ncbi:MAG: sensor histidine kinase [Acidimicrobiales bacterium]
MKQWRRVRAAAALRPTLADGLLSALLLAAALFSIWVEVEAERLSDPSYRLPDMSLVLLVTALAITPLVARRRFPLAVLGAATAAVILARLIESPEDDIGFGAVLVAAYSAGAYGAVRRRSRVFAVIVASMALELARPFLPHLDQQGALLGLVFDVGFNLTILGVFWALGVTTRARRETERELVLRAAELERQREENARRAVFEERVRIARELHDVVAHHVSVMGIQAGAARTVMIAQPGKAQDALTSIESASRHAVVELHRMLGFLRQEGEADDPAPQPTLRELDALIEQVAQAELAVEVVVEGELRPLPPTLEVSAYRLVQEALTNTLKHAEASNATVRLSYGLDALDVGIVDDGRGDAGTGRAGVGGHGLIGMRERVSIHGGRFRAGPRLEGGFEVWATFPLNGAGT